MHVSSWKLLYNKAKGQGKHTITVCTVSTGKASIVLSWVGVNFREED